MDPMGCESPTVNGSRSVGSKNPWEVNSCHMGPSFVLFFLFKPSKNLKNETILVKTFCLKEKTDSTAQNALIWRIFGHFQSLPG